METSEEDIIKLVENNKPTQRPGGRKNVVMLGKYGKKSTENIRIEEA